MVGTTGMQPFTGTSSKLLGPADSVAGTSCPGCIKLVANQPAGLSVGLVPAADGRASPDAVWQVVAWP